MRLRIEEGRVVEAVDGLEEEEVEERTAFEELDCLVLAEAEGSIAIVRSEESCSGGELLLEVSCASWSRTCYKYIQ